MGDQNCIVIPESSLSLRPADASLYHLEASKLGVLGGEGNFQGSPRGRGAHPAVSAFLHAPFAFRHPTFHKPHPCCSMQATHIYANTLYSFCKDGHMGSSWDSQAPFRRIGKGARIPCPASPGTLEWVREEKQQVQVEFLISR